MTTAEHRVFVYGTLKRGNFNNRLLSDAVFVGKAITTEPYPLVIGSRYNIPFLLPFPGQGQLVQGEVFVVNDEQLEILDQLEMHPHVYQRQSISVFLTSDEAESNSKAHSSPCQVVCESYFLVRSLPELLRLPHLNRFLDGVNDKWYVNPLLRIGEPFRFEVQFPPEGTQDEIEAWRKL